MKTKVTVGEMAKIHNISAQTLRYYDKIQLFSPQYVDKNNGYRYYGIDQFALLDAILFLRTLGLSIKDIKDYLKDRKLNDFLNILELQKKSIRNEIKRLQILERSIESKLTNIKEQSLRANSPEVKIEGFKERYMLYVTLESRLNKVEFEYNLIELSGLIKKDEIIFDSIITLTMKKEDFINKKNNKWNSMALLFQNNPKVEGKVALLPSGDYACITYYGSYNMGEEYMEALLKWCEENSYEPAGDVLVLNIAEAAFSDEEVEFITEIQLPIKKFSK
ncbi:MerR family transcriptional regulator [Clostridium polynesiense]|uniref:MerR family transcriptional regulator n=1 Tax=Clostridium polynesiense TaxID=1325933 RepID=UPI00058F2658|nr:MerR family transcriptional regulator [Clostridium polynesiense]